MQAHLDLRAAKERAVEVAGADGIARTQGRASTRTLETIVGEVTVTRRVYQAPGRPPAPRGWRPWMRR